MSDLHRPGTPPPAPPALVLIGAALGTGRWLAEHLLPHAQWSSVTLIDSKTTKTSLRSQTWRLAEQAPIAFGENVETEHGDEIVIEGSRTPLAFPDVPTVAWFAISPAVLPSALEEMIPRFAASTEIVVSASPIAPALEIARRAAARRGDGLRVHGVHPLFDASVPSLAGQILYVVPAPAATIDGSDGRSVPTSTEPDVPPWLADAAANAGGIVKVGTADHHDRTMELVQTHAHRILLDFADRVTDSGLDLERDIWEARTPLFETLFGLAVRVLDSRDSTIDPVEAASVRERFPGSLYDTIRGTAASAVGAAQSKRLLLARFRRSGEVIGLRALGDRRVRIGRIAELASTTVTLDELVIGPTGRAALLDGPGIPNAVKLGLAGAAKPVSFGLGHVEPVTGDELEAVLDATLAHLRRDVRFLVPESVSGDGVLQVVRVTPGLRDCALVDEVVRTGQRSVVIRMAIRADLDPAAVAERLQAQVAAAYRWPSGLARMTADPVDRVAYLGPAGTFSEDAAALAAAAVGAPDAALEPLGSFPEVLAALALPGTIGVLPITSSASGLVSRSVAALLAAGSGNEVAAGGIVDVGVRFDAYARAGAVPESAAGVTVYCHPQARAQCSAFIRRLGLLPVEVESNAAALVRAAASTEPALAIGGAGRGEAVGLEVYEREIDDLSGSITRFLIVGAAGAWSDHAPGSAPTLRQVWIGAGVEGALPLLTRDGAAFDELLADADGRWLLISSRTSTDATGAATLLGAVPWSPRTPVVRA